MPVNDSSKAERAPRASTVVLARILSMVDTFIEDPVSAEKMAAEAQAALPAEVFDNLALLSALPKTQPYTYRDALVVQLGFGLAIPGMDHTIRAEGARPVGDKLGKEYPLRHIPSVKGAFQNIGKNITELARGNVTPFDFLLRWANTAPQGQRLALLTYIAARTAQAARPVLSMPPLRVAALTFASMAKLLDELLKAQSGGAYQQFAVASFLDALLYEFGLGGTVGGLRVETKNINASDASTGSTADVQIMRGNKIEEAFEVSANNWRSKVAQAIAAASNADLSRTHIIAASDGDDTDLKDLDGASADVTVADVRSFLRILAAAVRKPAREHALNRLYELVDRNQPDPELTNRYVRLLGSLQLTAD
jgi:hypothetical protein